MREVNGVKVYGDTGGVLFDGMGDTEAAVRFYDPETFPECVERPWGVIAWAPPCTEYATYDLDRCATEAEAVSQALRINETTGTEAWECDKF